MPHPRNLRLLTLALLTLVFVSFALLPGWHFSSAQTTRALPPQAPSSQQPVAPTAAPMAAKMLAPNSTTQTFGPSAAITIPLSGNAAPYPSNITVSGVSSLFTRLEVRLNGFTHTYPDDVDILLVGPQGQRAILMSDAGNDPNASNLNLTFAQTATTPIPDATALTTGTFRPANYVDEISADPTDTFPAPGPGALTDAPADLFAFNGINPNGTWNLYVVDDVGSDSGSISGGWTLTFTVPQVFTVTNTLDSGAGSLRDAITLAQNGDLINFSSLFNTPQTINLLTALPDIFRSITIQGTGANLLTVRRDFNAATDFRIFTIPSGVANGVAISGMTITGGVFNSGVGGGIFSGSNLTLTNVHVTGNQANTAGGVNLALADGVFTGCTISGNTAAFSGGINFLGNSGRTLRIVNSTISGNNATVSGGGITNQSLSGNSRLEVINSTIANNTTVTGGGILTQTGNAGSTATTTLRNTVITGNTTTNLATLQQNGGGAATFQTLGFNLSDNYNGVFTPPMGTDITSATPRLAPLALYGGRTPTHALLHASPAINAGDASGQATDQRGAARVFGSTADIGAVEMRPVVVDNNSDGLGSLRLAIASVSAPFSDIQFDNTFFSTPRTIELITGQLTISSNVNIIAPGAGSVTVSGRNAFRVFEVSSGVTFTLSGMTITGGNSGSGDAGGILNNGTLTVTHSTISANTSGGKGGGIWNSFSGVTTVTNSTISGNTSTSAFAGTGGGIDSTGSLTVTNSTISDNRAPSGTLNGGGIWSTSATATITNSTITNNSAAGAISASGVFKVGGTVNIRNSIIAGNVGNATQPDVVANNGTGITSNGFNLIGNRGAVTFNQTGDQFGTGSSPLAPRLAPLALNGGTTPTHALFAGSPALEAGQSSGFTSDQRGSQRPFGSPGIMASDGADIGAFEAQAAPPNAPTVSIGDVSLNEGNAGTTNFTFTVSLSAASGSSVTVAYQTADGTADTSDYSAVGFPITLTFNGGETSKTITIPVNGDTTIEANETFFVNLLNANGATIADGQGLGTIQNDDGLNITTVAPQAGRTAGGQSVILTGSFINLQTVTIGGLNAPFTGNTTQITVTTPAHAAGAVDIVLTPTSGSPFTKTNAFAYLPTVFTDDTLVVGMTTAKAQHITELRNAVDSLRLVAGLVPAPWTDATLSPSSTIIKAVHITELRTYLEQAAMLLGYGTGSYTEPGLSSGLVIKRVHIEELRQRIRTMAG